MPCVIIYESVIKKSKKKGNKMQCTYDNNERETQKISVKLRKKIRSI